MESNHKQHSDLRKTREVSPVEVISVADTYTVASMRQRANFNALGDGESERPNFPHVLVSACAPSRALLSLSAACTGNALMSYNSIMKPGNVHSIPDIRYIVPPVYRSYFLFAAVSFLVRFFVEPSYYAIH